MELLNDVEATKYRALAARANYLAADRTDIMYAVKEICRSMAAPTRGAWKSSNDWEDIWRGMEDWRQATRGRERKNM